MNKINFLLLVTHYKNVLLTGIKPMMMPWQGKRGGPVLLVCI